MSEIVNLRLVRKAKRRADAEAEAAANRVRHGRTLGARAAQAMEADHARRVLDGARRVGDPDRDHGD